MKQRIYVDTSVVGGCLDEEFSKWSVRLFDDFRQGLRIAVVSDLTRRELEHAPEEVRGIPLSLPAGSVEEVYLSEEAETLARNYVEAGVVSARDMADAQHIAIASVARVDVLVSWNFRQIVNLRRIRGYNSVNLKLGYPMLEIRSPREVIHEENV